MDVASRCGRPAPRLAHVWLCGDGARLRPLLAKLQKTSLARTRLFSSCCDAYCALDRGEQCDFWVVHTTAGDGPCMLPLDCMLPLGIPRQNILLYLVGDDPLPSTWCALLTRIQAISGQSGADEIGHTEGIDHGNHSVTRIDTKV